MTLTQATRRLSALYEKLIQDEIAYISKSYFFGRALYDLQQYMGPRKFRKSLLFSATCNLVAACKARGKKPTEQEISKAAARLLRDIQDFIAIAFDPDVESRVDPSFNTKFLDEWEKLDSPTPFIGDFNSRLKKQQLDIELHKIKIGERLAALRKELGKHFERVLERRCPSIPLDRARQLMQNATDSPIARVLHRDDNAH